MTSYARDEMVSVTDIVKGFKANLEKVTGHAVEKLAIMRNNKPEAVIVPVDEYEKMKELYDYAERLSIFETVQKRRNNGKLIPFDEVLKRAGLTHDDLRD
ncbi:MAG: type II toxin-antitoxin system Phd/YefM family antitoxin [Campylobacterales bacterium]